MHVLVADEWSWRRSPSDRNWMSPAGYVDASPDNDWCTRHASLKVTRCRTEASATCTGFCSYCATDAARTRCGHDALLQSWGVLRRHLQWLDFLHETVRHTLWQRIAVVGGIVICRSQWSSGNTPDCGVRGPRFESHRGQLHVFRENHYDIQPWARLHTLTAVPRSTQPSTIHRMVKWISAFGLSNNNKCRRWV